MIAALDPDDRMAMETALVAAIHETQRDATEHHRAERGRQVAAAAAAQQAEEAAKTDQEREEDRRRKLDAELDQAKREQHRGRQRKL